MNLFILSHDPIEAAQMQCNKHVVKMTVETAQILCTVGTGIYRKTHHQHPCVLWTKQSQANFDWVLKHGFALCDEYMYRYGKQHKTQAVLTSIQPPDTWDQIGLTDFVQVMPDSYKKPNPIEAYRHYYHTKASFAQWTKRSPPTWWQTPPYI